MVDIKDMHERMQERRRQADSRESPCAKEPNAPSVPTWAETDSVCNRPALSCGMDYDAFVAKCLWCCNSSSPARIERCSRSCAGIAWHY